MCYTSAVITLGIETSSPHGSVALLNGEHLLARQSHEEPNAHAERMMALVEAAFEKARLRKDQLQRIAVGVGPGSFTGLRVGLALAQGLSLGLGVPLVGVSSLAVVAHGAKRIWKEQASESTEPIPWFVPVLDARRDELFFAAYDVEDREQIAPTTLPVSEAERRIAEQCAGRPLKWCGSALQLLARSDSLGASFPDAEDAGRLAQRIVPQHEVHLQYLRDADAKRPCLPPNPLPPSAPPAGT